MSGFLLALIAITSIIILSFLIPTYHSEEELPRPPKIEEKSDPIAVAIKRLREGRA